MEIIISIDQSIGLKKIYNLGHFLYHHRGIIPAPFFILIIIFAREANLSSIPFIITGIGLRLWAVGYLGQKSRGSEFNTESKIENGPFKLLKHPIYFGNFFLVCGVIILFNPQPWLSIIIILCFIAEYSIISNAETRYLKNLTTKKEKFQLRNLKAEWPTVLIIILIYLIALCRNYLIK